MKSSVLRIAACLVAPSLAAMFACGGSASAAPAPVGRLPATHILGLVPARNAVGAATSSNNLIYHGGSVEHSNTTYAIYWIPSGYSVSAKYESLINGFLANVAAASGSTTNVYYSDTQYSDGSGNISL